MSKGNSSHSYSCETTPFTYSTRKATTCEIPKSGSCVPLLLVTQLMMKVGWPGVIVVEGEEGSCEDFVCTLRGWRWKHLAVRGEETMTVPGGRTLDQERLLPLPLEELGEKDGVSALAKRCREAGLGELFSTLLR